MIRTLHLLLLGAAITIGTFSQAQNPDIEIETSNTELKKTFDWAKEKALSYVMTAKKGAVNKSEISAGTGNVTYMPCYWAGYPHRSAFYSRDYCHQMDGAHLLGLYRENFVMLKAFAKSAGSELKWYPLWAINFDGSIYTLDYRNENNFVREVPATFELVEKGYKQLLWTGNKELINDPTIWNYYKKAVDEFVSLHDSIIPNGIAEGDGSGSIFRGVATYNEDNKLVYVEAADGVSCQFRAFEAYAKMLEIKGQKDEAAKFFAKANALKKTFNSDWANKSNQIFYRGRTKDGTYIDGFGRETSFFILLKNICEDGEKSEKFLDYVAGRLNVEYEKPVNIESITYLPDIFFAYNRVEDGWKWTKTIMNRLNNKHVVEEAGLNSDYPEVSYTFISNVIENIMGVEPDALNNRVSTISRLPKEINRLGVKHLTIGMHKMDIMHNGSTTTTLAHTAGVENLNCNIRFYGNHSTILVNGVPKKAQHSTLRGQEISSIEIPVVPGEKVIVTVK